MTDKRKQENTDFLKSSKYIEGKLKIILQKEIIDKEQMNIYPEMYRDRELKGVKYKFHKKTIYGGYMDITITIQAEDKVYTIIGRINDYRRLIDYTLKVRFYWLIKGEA